MKTEATLKTGIELRGVSKSYRMGSSDVRALTDVDLGIEPGQFVVILGPSGSGKTTLLNLIGAIDTPTSGSITIGGLELGDLDEAERAAYRRTAVGLQPATILRSPCLKIARAKTVAVVVPSPARSDVF